MAITVSGFDSQHSLDFTTQEGLRAYTLTGLVLIDFGGAPGGQFVRDTLRFSVPIPDLPAGQGLQLTHWAPFVTLNAISNDGTATDALWAVDTFAVTNAGPPLRSIDVAASLAVRDVDGFILRVGYVLQLLGSLVTLPPS
jgi:hypothetical protein